jgi:amidase
LLPVGVQEDCRREAAEIRRHNDAVEGLAWADGLDASAGDYISWFGHREHYRAAFRAFFEKWDVLLSPANLVNAFLHGENPLKVNGQAVNYDWQFVYAGLARLSGHPATAFPVGQTRSGLPIGLQAIGPYLEDHTPMGFAALVAQEFGGFRPPPGFDAAWESTEESLSGQKPVCDRTARTPVVKPVNVSH